MVVSFQVQAQLERLVRLNADYRRKTTLTQRQSKNLIQEKAELQAQLHDKEQQISRIHDGMKEHEMVDGHPPSSPVSRPSLK